MSEWRKIKPPLKLFSGTVNGNTWFFHMEKAWESEKHIVMSHFIEEHGLEHIVICRKDSHPVSWNEKQKIKNELFGEERMAIEVFPKQSELVDDQNVYHLWLISPEHEFSLVHYV